MTLPRPLAADGRVDHDPDTRTLIVRPAPDADGYAKLLWREGHAAMVKAEQRHGGPSVWADGGGKHQSPAVIPVRPEPCDSSSHPATPLTMSWPAHRT